MTAPGAWMQADTDAMRDWFKAKLGEADATCSCRHRTWLDRLLRRP